MKIRLGIGTGLGLGMVLVLGLGLRNLAIAALAAPRLIAAPGYSGPESRNSWMSMVP